MPSFSPQNPSSQAGSFAGRAVSHRVLNELGHPMKPSKLRAALIAVATAKVLLAVALTGEMHR